MRRLEFLQDFVLDIAYRELRIAYCDANSYLKVVMDHRLEAKVLQSIFETFTISKVDDFRSDF